jgi:hypothetical protein
MEKTVVIKMVIDRRDHNTIKELSEEETRSIQDQYRHAIKEYIRVKKNGTAHNKPSK